MHFNSSLAGAGLAFLSLSQPVLAAPAGSTVYHAHYVCDDGTKLAVRFVEQSAYVTLADGTKLVLPQQMSGSGFWYSSGRFELRGKGRDATWTVGRKVPANCHAAG